MTELKPCPFCGSRNIDFGVMTGTMSGWTYCQCEECLAEIHVLSPLIDEAIKAWNRRSDDAEVH